MLRHRLFQAVVQQRVDAPNHSGAEAFVPEFGEVFALDLSAFLEIVVEPLDLNGSQLVQWDVPNSGDDVVFDVVGVVLNRVYQVLLYLSDHCSISS